MGILARYVLGEVLRVLAFALVIFTGVFFLFGLFGAVRQGLGMLQLLAILPYLLPYPLPYVLPFSALLAATLAFGKLVAENEVLALRACGVHLSTLVVPVLLLASVLALGAVYVNGEVVPYCHRRKNDTVRASFEALLNLGNGSAARFDLHGRELYIGRHQGRDLEDVIFIHEVEGRRVKLMARSASVSLSEEGDRITLRFDKGSITTFDHETGRWSDGGVVDGLYVPIDIPQRTARPEYLPTRLVESELAAVRSILGGSASGPAPGSLVLEGTLTRTAGDATLEAARWAGRRLESVRLTLRVPGGEAAATAPVARIERPADGVPVLSLEGGGAFRGDDPAAGPLVRALDAEVETRYREKDVITRLVTEVHRRWSLAAACLSFVLLGVPIPLVLRQNNRLVPFFVGLVAIAPLYYVPFFAGDVLARQGFAHPLPAIAMWGGNALCGGVGLALVVRVVRRS
ncbi:MAG: LptF/LptG family permease [Planctomycetes bacterium]|nr:LptF/LptG family permease [Planctomycetota bacterium]